MKISLLGIAIILFGIAMILASTGTATTIGLGISFFGLFLSAAGCFIKDTN